MISPARFPLRLGGAFHFSLIVIKDSQVRDFLGQAKCDGRRIFAVDADQNRKAGRGFSDDTRPSTVARARLTC
jgi:hypothetical protein